MRRLLSNRGPKIVWSTVVVASLAATWFLGGSTFLAIRWALVSFPPFFQIGSQFVIAGILLGVYSRLRGVPWPSRRNWVAGGILGTLMLGGGYGLTAEADASVSSGLIITFIAIVPTLIVLFELPYGIRPSGLQRVGITVGLIGIVLLTFGQGFRASPSGLIWVASGCCGWALGSVWAIHGLPGGTKLHVAQGLIGYAIQMIVGGAVLLIASRLTAETPQWPPDPAALASWIYLLLASSLIVFTAYMILLERTPPAVAASYAYVNPVVGLALGVTLNHETVSPFEWLSVGVVLIGVVVLLYDQPRA